MIPAAAGRKRLTPIAYALRYPLPGGSFGRNVREVQIEEGTVQKLERNVRKVGKETKESMIRI